MQQPQPQPKKTGKILGILLGIIALGGILFYMLSKKKTTGTTNTDTSGNTTDTSVPKTNTQNANLPIGPYPNRCMKKDDRLRKGKNGYTDDTSANMQKVVHKFFDRIKVNYGKTGVAFGFMKGIDVEVTERNLIDLQDEYIKYMNSGKALDSESMVTKGEFLCESGNYNLRLVKFLN